MNIKFLGTGGVFDYELGSSSAIVKTANCQILIDCGPLVYPLMAKSGCISEISHILLTHLHGDHVGSLFQLILDMNLRSEPGRKSTIVYPSHAFLQEIEAFLTFWFPQPRDVVEFVPLSQIDGVGALDTTNKHIVGITSFAYYFTDGSSLIYFSGDVGDVTVAADFLRDRKETNVTVFHEIHHLKGSAHTHYRDVMNQLSDYKVFGYHCNPAKIPADNTIPLVANTPDLLFENARLSSSAL